MCRAKNTGHRAPDGIFIVHYCIKHLCTQPRVASSDGNNEGGTHGPHGFGPFDRPAAYYRRTIGPASIKRAPSILANDTRVTESTRLLFTTDSSTIASRLHKSLYGIADHPRYLCAQRTENYYNCYPKGPGRILDETVKAVKRSSARCAPSATKKIDPPQRIKYEKSGEQCRATFSSYGSS